MSSEQECIGMSVDRIVCRARPSQGPLSEKAPLPRKLILAAPANNECQSAARGHSDLASRLLFFGQIIATVRKKTTRCWPAGLRVGRADRSEARLNSARKRQTLASSCGHRIRPVSTQTSFWWDC